MTASGSKKRGEYPAAIIVLILVIQSPRIRDLAALFGRSESAEAPVKQEAK